jgi:large subunit ribosomal protein L17
MRHRNTGRKLSRTPAHRKALFANLANALIQHGRIQTTDAKAKELRRVAEKLVTLAKEGTISARRRAFAALRQEGNVAKLFSEIAPRFKERAGGYTRIMKLSAPRHGDNAPMAVIEFVDHESKA